jgi:hypothetical protein
VDLLLTGLNPDEINQLEELGKKASDFDLNRLFRSLVQCRKELEGSNLDRFILENYVMEWCLDPGLPNLQQWPVTAGATKSSPQAPAATSGGAAPSATPGQKSAAASPRQNTAAKGPSLKQRFQAQTQETPNKPQRAPAAVKQGASQSAADQKSSTSPAQPNSQPQAQPKPQPQQQEQAQSRPLSQPAPQSTPQASMTPATAGQPPRNQPQATEQGNKAAVAAAAAAGTWPADWRSLVDAWKKKKPLQARLLEEVYPKHYSASLIHVEVDPQSMAASRLLQPEIQNRLQEHFKKLFGFAGELRVTVLPEGAPKPTPVEATPEEPVEAPVRPPHEPASAASPSEQPPTPVEGARESLLDIKKREKRLAREQLKQELTTHPLTREVLQEFDGKITQIQFEDGTTERWD